MPFLCSSVLAPTTLDLLDPAASCVWNSAKNLVVTNDGTSTIRVLSPVVIRDNVIFAAPGSIAASTGSLVLQAPSNSIDPTITINGPTTVGSCDGIVSFSL